NTLCPADGAVLRKTEDALVGQVLAGKYRIEEKIDEGGMGCVYRATHVLMEKTVAVKVLHPALAADDKIVARFTREAKAASRISHPHAINVTDFGEDEEGVVFLVMEYLRGRTLKDIVRSEGPMQIERVCEIIRQVCGALEAAHSEGVVHRDLKSDNIMLEEVGDGDWAKVLDFGIAKIQETTSNPEDGLTAPNLIIGTPQYMSPEQCAQASEIDSRSDIYSLGVILYEMLVGHVPFTADSPTGVMMKHLQEPAPSVLDERDDLPPAFGRVVARSLAKRPEDRFQTAGELSEALALAMKGESNDTAAIAVGAANTRQQARAQINRIVVPTGENEPPRGTASEELEEATVVSARRRAPEPPPAVADVVAESGAPSILAGTSPPPPAASFSPWRIAVPAMAALLVIFAVVYALNRNAGTATTDEQGAPLTADPNSIPGQTTAPATGQSEQNIQPGAPVTTSSPGDLNTGTLPAGDLNTGMTVVTVTPTPGGEEKKTDEQQNAQQPQTDENANKEENPQPTPTPAAGPRRIPPSLQQPTPPQVRDQDGDEPPPVPKPKEKPKEEPKSSPPSPAAAEPPAPIGDAPLKSEPRS
ncbi:MAG TPA: protein kinase, partial [Pyrinomonadaceae bacterium]|nr:protein kinase [Pyrinomonadaceae bacterium]